MPSALRDQINLHATTQAELASREHEKLNQDEDKLLEIRRMVRQEQTRLEKMTWACDRLRQETDRRLSNLPTTDDINKCEGQLRRSIASKLLKVGMTNENEKGCIEGHNDSIDGDTEDDIQEQYKNVHDEIEATYKGLKPRDDLFKSLQDSSVIVGFHQTTLQKRYNKDELIIDFEQTQKFPAGLFIACAILQEVFVDSIMSHSNQDDYNHELDSEINNYNVIKEENADLVYCNGNGSDICPASKAIVASTSSTSLLSNTKTWNEESLSPAHISKGDLIIDSSVDGTPSSLFLSPITNGFSDKSASYIDKSITSSSSGTYKTAPTSPPTLSFSSALSSLSGSRANTPCPTAGNGDQTMNGAFGIFPNTSTEPSTAPQKSTWSEISKINLPVRDAPTYQMLPRPEKIVAETNRPHCFLDISVKSQKTCRIVIKVRPDKAPLMSENFIQLCTGKRGYGYKGSKFIRCKSDDHVVAGDIENNDGTGGRSIYGDDPVQQSTLASAFNNHPTALTTTTNKCFLAEQCSLRDHKGAVRMRGMERTTEGRCKVGSQFMVWVGDIEYKEYKYTLVFGEVTQGLKYLQEISRIGMFCNETTWLLKEDVVITNSGIL